MRTGGPTRDKVLTRVQGRVARQVWQQAGDMARAEARLVYDPTRAGVSVPVRRELWSALAERLRALTRAT